MHPSEKEEKQSISLTCNAEVGRPRGNIPIWRIFQNLKNLSYLIYTFNSTQTENCTGYVNATLIFLVTKGDNGAIFRSSS